VATASNPAKNVTQSAIERAARTGAKKPRPHERYTAIEPRLIVQFTVEGVPIPKARARYSPRNHQWYTPEETVNQQNRVLQACWLASPRLRPRPGRFKVDLVFYLPGGHHADWDNLAKGVCDALNHVCWDDDRAIADAHVHLEYWQEHPRTEVTVYQVEEPSS
jgi:Holliday junction resolvase RusA-like endonuclease